jgi:hypothetical protein
MPDLSLRHQTGHLRELVSRLEAERGKLRKLSAETRANPQWSGLEAQSHTRVHEDGKWEKRL